MPMSEEFRERVLAAAYDELTRWGIDRFSIVALADRHGLDLDQIQHHWGGAESLVVDLLLGWPNKQEFTLPDTGSLRTDLLALAHWMANYVSSEPGRSLSVAHVIGNRNMPTAHIRRAVWRARADIVRIVIDRAQARGDLRDGVDALSVLELLFAPIHMRELFTAEPVDEEYCRTVTELVYRAIAAPK
jgi:hypothetical protein